MNIWLIVLIGISLSMDTFSLSLSIGTFNIDKKTAFIFSSIVAIFHFIMPIIGQVLGTAIQSIIVVNPNKLLATVLFFICIEMIIDILDKKEHKYDLKLINMIVYAFSVSIDSLSIGIGMSGVLNNSYLSSVVFSLISFSFTIMGLAVGKYWYNKLGKLASFLGIAMVLVLAIIHLLK